jgi:hypothetical protein
MSIEYSKTFFSSVTTTFSTWKTHKWLFNGLKCNIFVNQKGLFKDFVNLQMEYP